MIRKCQNSRDCSIYKEARCFQIKTGAVSNVTENHKNQQSDRILRRWHIEEKTAKGILITFNVRCDILRTWVHVVYLPKTLNPRFLIDYWWILTHYSLVRLYIEGRILVFKSGFKTCLICTRFSKNCWTINAFNRYRTYRR